MVLNRVFLSGEVFSVYDTGQGVQFFIDNGSSDSVIECINVGYSGNCSRMRVGDFVTVVGGLYSGTRDGCWVNAEMVLFEDDDLSVEEEVSNVFSISGGAS